MSSTAFYQIYNELIEDMDNDTWDKYIRHMEASKGEEE